MNLVCLYKRSKLDPYECIDCDNVFHTTYNKEHSITCQRNGIWRLIADGKENKTGIVKWKAIEPEGDEFNGKHN